VARQFLDFAHHLLQTINYAILMAVMMPRERWTDERLDDLNAKVDQGFADTKVEMREGFARVDTEIRGLRSEMNARFDALNRNLIAGMIAITAAIIGSNATLVGIALF
jgi:hypothetical protein